MTRTRWIIDEDQIKLLPHLRLNMFGALAVVLFLALGLLGKDELLANPSSKIGYFLIFGATPLFLFLSARNSIVFNNTTQEMCWMIFGIIPYKTIPFGDIAAIRPVLQLGAELTFKVFTVNNKHGKGIKISSIYANQSSSSAISFTTEVLPQLKKFITMADNL